LLDVQHKAERGIGWCPASQANWLTLRHESCQPKARPNCGRDLKLASLYYGALKVAGVSALARRFSTGGLVLCYHNVVSDASASDALGLHMPLATFARQMGWLARTYDIVPLAELVSRLSNGESARGLAAVTFDDGYSGVFANAWPVLRDLGIPATVFIIADAPERDECFWWDEPEVLRAYSPARRQEWLTTFRGDSAAIGSSLAAVDHSSTGRPPVAERRHASWQAITEAARSGLQLGAHSVTHRALPVLDDVELHNEIVQSRETVISRTGVTPELFAYPYGLWDERVRGAVRAAGYRGAVTLDHSPHSTTTDPWALPRMNIPARIGDAAFQAWTAGLNPRRRDA
jgi:peptidoglycan/xylan/chitin deacetylase (PgdA/CDA1 family)